MAFASSSIHRCLGLTCVVINNLIFIVWQSRKKKYSLS